MDNGAKLLSGVIISYAILQYTEDEVTSLLYSIPYSICCLSVILAKPSSPLWRVFSGVGLLSSAFLSLFLIVTIQPLTHVPGIQLTEIRHLFPLGLSPLFLIHLRLHSSSNFVQSVLLYLMGAVALLSLLFPLTQYYGLTLTV